MGLTVFGEKKEVRFLMNIRAYVLALTDHEIAVWSLVATVIFGMVAVLAVIVAARAKHDSKQQLDLARRVAAAERVFDAPDLECHPFAKDCPDGIVIGTSLTKDHVNEIPLTLIVGNNGTKAADDVTLYIRFPNELAYNNAISIEGSGPAVIVRNTKVVFTPSENFATFVVSIPKVQTYEVIPITIPLSVARATEFSGAPQVELKDGIVATIPYTVFYGYKITVFMACDGASPVSRVYSVQIINTAGFPLGDAISQRSTYLRQNATRANARKSWFGRIGAKIRYAWRAEVYLKKLWAVVISDEDKQSDSNGIIDRFDTTHMKVYEGLIDGRDGTMFVPGIGTNLFGQETKS